MHSLLEVTVTLAFFLAPCLFTNLADAFILRER